MDIQQNQRTQVSAAIQCCWILVSLACVGCQNPKGLVIAPPEVSFPNRPTNYYAPAFGTAPAANVPLSNPPATPISLAPEAAKTDANSSLLPVRPGSPLPAIKAGEMPAKSAPLVPDTYDITARIPQDSQPIRVVERGTNIAANSFTPRGMIVNDGTRATVWGQPANPSGSTFGSNSTFGNAQTRPAGISMAGLRGTTISPSNPAESSSFSNRDGQWKSRGSYEPTERR